MLITQSITTLKTMNTAITSQSFLIPLVKTFHPSPLPPFCPHFQEATGLLSVITIYNLQFAFSRILYKWNHFGLASFSQHSYLEIHSGCWVHWKICSLLLQSNIHCVDILQFVYLITCWRTFGLFPIFYYNTERFCDHWHASLCRNKLPFILGDNLRTIW